MIISLLMKPINSWIVCTKGTVFQQKLLEKAYFTLKLTGSGIGQLAGQFKQIKSQLPKNIFRRPYRSFSIALKEILSSSYCHKFSPVINYELKFVKMHISMRGNCSVFPFLRSWKLTCFLTTSLSATLFETLMLSAFLYISKTARFF